MSVIGRVGVGATPVSREPRLKHDANLSLFDFVHLRLYVSTAVEANVINLKQFLLEEEYVGIALLPRGLGCTLVLPNPASFVTQKHLSSV